MVLAVETDRILKPEEPMMKVKKEVRAFSLVELVIVVVIIGVIAAIAVPRISRGAKGAGESATRMSLTGMRNAIDMFSAEHGGAWPGADGLEATLITHMTTKTDAAGGITGDVIFGPYLRGAFPPIPVGPNVGENGVMMTTTDPPTGAVNEILDPTLGWVYNYETGEICANTDDPDDKGDLFYTY